MTENDENRESITLISYDPNGNGYKDSESMDQRLRSIINYILSFTDLETIIEYVRFHREEKIFILILDDNAMDVLASVHSFRSVDSIFIYGFKTEKCTKLFNEYPKVIGVFYSLNDLCLSLEKQTRIVGRQYETFSIFKSHQRAIKNMSKQFATYLWFQLFSDIIMRFPHDDRARQKMIHFCRQQYHDNPHELRNIDKFEREYESSEAIVWYSKQSFVYKLINKALRTEDIDLLYIFRYYLSDLTESLARERRAFAERGETQLKVYRGTKLSIEEFEEVNRRIGQVLSTNGFWSTSRNRTVALSFAPSLPKNEMDYVSVLFEIDCDLQELDESVNVADIARFSNFPSEEEVLFGLNICFRIESIDSEENLSIVKLSTSNEHLSMTKQYIQIMHSRLDDFSTAVMYGRLLTKVGQYDKALQYFENLLKEPNDEDIAWIELSMGQAWQGKGLWMKANEYFNRAYDRMMSADPPRIKDSACIIQAIGLNLYKQGDYNQSMKFLQQTDNIRTMYYPSDHFVFGKNLNNIGRVHYRMGKYSDALKFFQDSYLVRQKHHPLRHISIAVCFVNIAETLLILGKYNEALDYIQEALLIREAYYPDDHIFIAYTLGTYANILWKQGKLNQALHESYKSLTIMQNHVSSNHEDLGWRHVCIGDILFEQGKNREAFDEYQAAERIQKKCSRTHPDLGACFDGLGNLHFNDGQYVKAIAYYRQALTMKYQYLLHNHLYIAKTLFRIGRVYRHTANYPLALQYQQKSLKMHQEILPLEHPDIENIQKDIADLYTHLRLSLLALKFYEQDFFIQKKLL